MIITNTINLNNFPAMEMGVRVVAVTVNYYPFAKTPPEEGYQIEYEGKLLKIEDTAPRDHRQSDALWYNGLVHAPQLPQFPIVPGGGLAQATVYWMCAAQFAGLRAGKGNANGRFWAREYADLCIERAQMAGKDRPKHERVAKKIVDLVTTGGRWYVHRRQPRPRL